MNNIISDGLLGCQWVHLMWSSVYLCIYMVLHTLLYIGLLQYIERLKIHWKSPRIFAGLITA